jgi:hypothetical protein
LSRAELPKRRGKMKLNLAARKLVAEKAAQVLISYAANPESDPDSYEAVAQKAYDAMEALYLNNVYSS